MPRAGIWKQALGLSKTTIERGDAEQDTNTTGDDDTRLVIHVRPTRSARYGVIVALAPWARHDAGHTLAFDDQVAWLATHTTKSTVPRLMRIARRTVDAIIARVADVEAATDRFADLRRIGIDEISYKCGHRYLTVLVDHDTRRLLWAADGRNAHPLRTFFDILGPERSPELT